ncbi:Rpr2-domain-containing protein [Dichomitus squalens LYAD-421 SS1]|uniref:Rpr2-domain-containing protein n=1 Tax=Dichomitus squalens (strain LYAD-421) TaxID=732165 RepID=R7SNG2_DICSQ|nr:Rpr2-domain-containing protein [Dichomitus squalens LYAD-421 SS1]EJF57641.1 Rpr2-domain-containing protein [Dichomitus squalens LYAD-421 SS1]
MGKKNKEQEPAAKLNSVTNRDIIQRINFLYQASTYLSTISQPPDGTVQLQRNDSTHGKRKKNTIRHPKSTAELSRCYVGSMRIVGQKAIVRMDPSLKRTLCKQCDTVLLPGATASVRVKPSGSHGQVVTYTCLSCSTSRRIPAPPVLDLDASTAEPFAPSTPVDRAPSSSAPGPLAEALSDIMDVYAPSQEASVRKRGRPRNHRRRPVPRIPPLFERPGHVVFRGNEVLPSQHINGSMVE